jgi:hypothetical protein
LAQRASERLTGAAARLALALLLDREVVIATAAAWRALQLAQLSNAPASGISITAPAAASSQSAASLAIVTGFGKPRIC